MAPRPDHAQYLDSWLTVMKADKKGHLLPRRIEGRLKPDVSRKSAGA